MKLPVCHPTVGSYLFVITVHVGLEQGSILFNRPQVITLGFKRID